MRRRRWWPPPEAPCRQPERRVSGLRRQWRSLGQAPARLLNALLVIITAWCQSAQHQAGIPSLGLGVVVHAAVPADQLNALTDLYVATNGAAWTTTTHWLAGDPCVGAWFGVECFGTDVV